MTKSRKLFEIGMRKINELFGIDLRALGIFRICLGLILLYDVTTRLPDVNTFYSDAGLLPRLSLIRNSNYPEMYSLHLMSGSCFVQAILLLLQALCAVSLMVGYKSRRMIK